MFARIPELLSVIGFAQGASVCVFLYARRRHARPGNHLLILMTVALSLRLLTGAAVRGAWLPPAPAVLDTIGAAALLMVWPLQMLYLQRLAREPSRARTRVVLLPALAALAGWVSAAGATWLPPFGANRAAVLRTPDGTAALFSAMGIIVVYAGLSLYRAWRGNGPAWARWFTVLSALVPAALAASLLTSGTPARMCLLLEVACEVALVCYLQMLALVHPRLFTHAAPAPRALAGTAGRADVALLRTRLLVYMQSEQPWRSPELRISTLAASLDLPPHLLSATINREFGCNFFDFLNGYRVQEAARLLLDPQRRHYTILSAGMEVGFASKASFNRAFKKHMGVTPSEYQRRGGPPLLNSHSS